MKLKNLEIKNSGDKIKILSHQEINDMLNKFGPEGLYGLANELIKYADNDVSNAITVTINNSDICYHNCNYFGIEEGKIMVCKHPYFNDKEIYSNFIITQGNSRNGNVPNECPLKKK